MSATHANSVPPAALPLAARQLDAPARLRYATLVRNAATQRAVRDRFGLACDDEALQRLAGMFDIPGWVQGAISLADALFLYEMVRCVRPARVIEVGVAWGASTSVILFGLADTPAGPVPLVDALGGEAGAALPAVHAFDLHPYCYFARSTPVGSGVQALVPHLARAVQFHTRQTAHEAGAMFAADPWGSGAERGESGRGGLGRGGVRLALIDADHRHPCPTADLLALLPALAPGAWVVLHDIQLPRLAREHEMETGQRVPWNEHGAQHLFDHWPFEKFAGCAEDGAGRGGAPEGPRIGGSNIGAIRIPADRPITARDLKPIIGLPWETAPPERAAALLRAD